MRLTKSFIKVATVLIQQPDVPHYGYELSKAAGGVRSCAIYPMLTKMLELGWLADFWEDPETVMESRPPRRFYMVTDEGMNELRCRVALSRVRPRS